MAPVKKTWLIGPMLVRRAQKVCGARTETGTVTRAVVITANKNDFSRIERYTPFRWIVSLAPGTGTLS